MLPTLSTNQPLLISNIGLTVNLTAEHRQWYYHCTNIGIIVHLEVQPSRTRFQARGALLAQRGRAAR